MSTKKTVATKKEETKKVVALTQDELNNVIKALDKDVFVRQTTNDDLAVEIFETATPKTRCGLWQRGKHGKRYDLYIGNETKYYNKAIEIAHQTYVDDKKMSKKEVAFLKCSLDDIKNIINELTKTETKKATTKTKTKTKKEEIKTA